MPNFLDDEDLDSQGPTLGDVLEAAQRRLRGSDRVVVEVTVDGDTLSPADLRTRKGSALGDAEVRLYSAVPRDLAVSALAQARESLQSARQAQEQAAHLLQQDRSSDAMQEVARAIEVWQQTHVAIHQSARLCRLDLETRQFEDKPVAQFVEELLAGLRNVRDLIAASDFLALADALQYEWPSLLDRWDRFIQQMVAWIEAEA